MICKICNLEIGNKGISSHLRRRHGISNKDYYDQYLKKPDEGICPICHKETKFDTILTGYRNYCSTKCLNLDPKIRAKIEKTSIERYGVKCNLNTEETQMKARKNSQSTEAKSKRAKTNIKKYGAENVYASEQIKEKIKHTNLERYGVEYSWQSNKVKEKSKATSLAKYGIEHPQQSDAVKAKAKQMKVDRLQKFAIDNDCVSRDEVIEKYGYGWVFVADKIDVQMIYCGHSAFVRRSDLPKIKKYSSINHYQSSLFETEIIDYIKSIYSGEIITNTRNVLKPYELDIYIPDKKIAIECNGTFWHDNEHKDKMYHFNKSKACQELGIRLIHIYEWEWIKYPKKIKQLLNIALGSVSKIYARQCEVRLVSNQEAKLFNEATHIQGHRNAQVTYGLFYKDELVQLMSFSKTKYNRNLGDNDWEIIRGCPGSNNIVVGGVSKLFSHFIRDYKPSRVFSYCDFNKFDGKSYLALGMVFDGYTGPNKWIVIDRNTIVNRNPRKYSKLKSYPCIWGSGSLKFEWTNI